MIKGVHHIAISTASLERLSRFYCDVLGFEPVFEADWESGSEMGKLCDNIIGINDTASKVAMVSKNGVIIELFEYRSPSPKPIATDWRPCDHGYTHICLEVEDLDTEYERLVKAGMTFHAPPPAVPVNGMKAIYGKDPEGHVIELLEIVPAA
jgi:catechol 2,3-dioxygenase-like lactoylglutathione lyase family enzyme